MKITCIYDKETKAEEMCDRCERPLCRTCGYSYDDHRYCNECQEFLEAKTDATLEE